VEKLLLKRNKIMTIQLCPRCSKKYIDTTEEKACASCWALNPRQTDEEISKVYSNATEWAREQELADLTKEAERDEAMLSALEDEWQQERMERQERQAYEDAVLEK